MYYDIFYAIQNILFVKNEQLEIQSYDTEEFGASLQILMEFNQNVFYSMK